MVKEIDKQPLTKRKVSSVKSIVEDNNLSLSSLITISLEKQLKREVYKKSYKNR